MRKISNKESPWHHPLFTALFKFILTPASSFLATTSVRPHFLWGKLVPGRRVTAYELPWTSQLFLHFLVKLVEPFTVKTKCWKLALLA